MIKKYSSMVYWMLKRLETRGDIFVTYQRSSCAFSSSLVLYYQGFEVINCMFWVIVAIGTFSFGSVTSEDCSPI